MGFFVEKKPRDLQKVPWTDMFPVQLQNWRPFYPKFYFLKPQEINLTSFQEAIETVLEDHNDEWPLDIHWIRLGH